MKKEMLINVLQPEECRIAIVENGTLEELYVERSSQESYVGNIYKGRIVNIEGTIQAAFIDFGIGRNGFLHVSDVDAAYYKHLMSKDDLADYEAEQEREMGGGKGRGNSQNRNDRGRPGDRGPGPRPPQPMTSFLEPQKPSHRTPAPAPNPTPDDDELGEDFDAALDEDVPMAEEVIEALEPAAPFAPVVLPPVAHRPHTPSVPAPRASQPDDEDDFAAGIDEPLPTLAKAEGPRPVESRTAPVAKAAPVAPPEEDDFGAGIADFELPAHNPKPRPATPGVSPTVLIPAEPIVEAAPGLAVEVEPNAPEPPVEAEATESPEPAEAEPKKKPRATRKPKAKPDEVVSEAPEPTPEPPTEAKAKPKTRRTKKKTEGEGEADGDGSDDKPKFMGSAERRTSADEEPEIRPFFDDGSGFDPDAPNDRFDEEESAEGDADNEEELDEAEAAPVAEFDPGPDAEPQGTGVGRGFNDDFEDRGPPRHNDRNDRGRGGRGNQGGQGGQGGQNRDRGGPGRGDRDRGGPRGPGGPGGGFKGGPGGFKGGPKGGRDRGMLKPPIEQIFKRGQEVLVQVTKEAVGTKGPTLSTYISIAGRYLVLMPSLNRVGVSRKIEDPDARRRLREIMTTLAPPKGVGFIVRTAAIDRDARELRNDLAYLLRLWQVVVKRIKRVSGPVEIYRESDMITRTIRDIFTNDIDTIWVDEPTAFAHASEFLQIVMPKFASRIRHFDSTEPLFHKYGVEDEIVKIHQKRIEMPLGGSLIIEQTEALVAIDVNSGNFRADNNPDETAFQMNMHAAREIARQLRLRDLGGVIVNDFIDMRSETHRRKVEDAFRDALRRDRARTKILRISQFGLIEMTRQRIRPSLKRSIFSECPHCRGSGFVKTSESLSIDAMRLIQLAAHRAPAIASIQVGVHMDVAHYLLNKRRKELAAMEERGKLEVQVTGQVGVSPDTLHVRCFDHNGNEVRLLPPAPLPKLAGGKFPGPPRNDRRFPQPLD